MSFFNRPYMLTDRQVRNVTAVSASMLMIRRETFLALGGFGDYASDLAAGVPGAARQEAGLWNVFVPEAAAVWHGKEPPCLTGPGPGGGPGPLPGGIRGASPGKKLQPPVGKTAGLDDPGYRQPAGES